MVQVRRRPRALAASAWAGSLLVWLVVVAYAARPTYVDARVYRAEGAALLGGHDLYGPLVGVHGLATYPPFAALVFVPAALLPTSLVEAGAVVANLLLLLLVCWQSVRLVRGRGPWAAYVVPGLVLAAVALWCEPVLTTLSYGQVNLLLLALVLADANLPPDSRACGVGIGLAAAIKVTPAILVVHLLLTGRRRAAATAAATAVAASAAAALVAPRPTWDFWTRYVLDVDRVGRLENSANQSLRGWLVRALHTRDTAPLDLVVAVAVVVLGLTCAAVAHRRLGATWGLLAAAMTGLLASPISWTHHWVYCIPVVALLWEEARAWVLPALAVFWSYAVWMVPHGDGVELHLTAAEVGRSGWYVVFAVGFLVLTAVRSRAAVSGWPDNECRAGRIVPEHAAS